MSLRVIRMLLLGVVEAPPRVELGDVDMFPAGLLVLSGSKAIAGGYDETKKINKRK